MAKKATPSGNAAKTLSREVLVQHAARLAIVLRALRKQDANVTSDVLWQSIQQSWSEKDLKVALRIFRKTKRLNRFERLLQPLPQAGPDGFFMADGEKWGHTRALITTLKLNANTVASKRKECRSRRGITNGHIFPFYALADVKKTCATHLKSIPQADETGFYMAEDDEWGTAASIAKRLGIHRSMVYRFTSRKSSRVGKRFNGRRGIFHALSEVKRQCTHLLKPLPRVGSDGFFEADGKRWGTIRLIAKILQLSDATIAKRLDPVTSRKGILKHGRIADFYAQSEVEKIFSDFRNDLPKANADGMFKLGGERWGTAYAIARTLEVGFTTIASRTDSCRSCRGKNQVGHPTTFYALTDVRRSFSAHLKLQKADANGFFKADGKKWGTTHSIAHELNFPQTFVYRRLKNKASRRGRRHSGQIAPFYDLSVAKEVCAGHHTKKRSIRKAKPRRSRSSFAQ